jgi:hypothetical protein
MTHPLQPGLTLVSGSAFLSAKTSNLVGGTTGTATGARCSPSACRPGRNARHLIGARSRIGADAAAP